jgi:hypothetical protein
MDTVYVHIRHWLFWYGNYGLYDKSCNDEITLYRDKDQTKYLGYFDIMTKTCLKYFLENNLDENEDNEFYNEVNDFLLSDKDVYFSYIYPRFTDDIENQVTHFAPANGKGHKPVYIYMWTKLSDRLDVTEIKKCVKILVKEFFHEDVKNIEILDIPTYDEAKLSYEEDYAPHIQNG